MCNSNARCAEWIEFAKQVTFFCKDVIDIMGFEEEDVADIKISWKKVLENAKNSVSADDEKEDIKIRNKLIIVTPAKAKVLYQGVIDKASTLCFQFVIDKVSMHQAFDLDQDLLEIANDSKSTFDRKNILFKMVFTTNVKDD